MSTAFELVLNGVTRSNWLVIQVMDVLGPDPTIVVMLYPGPGSPALDSNDAVTHAE